MPGTSTRPTAVGDLHDDPPALLGAGRPAPREAFRPGREPALSVLAASVVLGGAAGGGLTMVTGPAAFDPSVLDRAGRSTGRGIQVLFADAEATTASALLLTTARRLVVDGFARNARDDSTLLAAHLARWSRRTPSVVVADDAALADPAHQAFLEEMARSAAAETMLAVYAWRTTGRQSLSLAEPYRRLALRQLSAGAVTELLRPRLPAGASPAGWYPGCGGNAALVAAALDDLAAATDDRPAGPGPRYRRAVREVLRQWPELLPAARALAVLGDHCGPAVLSHVLDLPLLRLSEVFDQLSTLDLLTPGHTLRAWVRTAVRAGAEPDVIRRLHLRAADVLHEDGATARKVAPHLLAAGQAPRAWAPGVLCEAAEEAVREGRYDDAAALLGLALDWTAAPTGRAEIRSRLLDVRWWSDPGRIPELLTGLATSARDGNLAGHRLARLPRLMAWQARADDAYDLLALAERQADDPRARMEHAISDLWIRHVFPGAPAGAPAELRPELVIGDRPWLPRAIALSRLRAAGDTDAAAAEAVEVLRRVVARESDLEAGQLAVLTLLSLERFEQTAAWYEGSAPEGSAGEPPQWRTLRRAAEATVALSRGEVDLAATRAGQALAAVHDDRWSVLVALPQAVLLMARTEQGRHDEVAAALAARLPEDFTRSPYGLLHLRARGRHHLATGAPQSAADDFRAIGDILTSWRLESPGLLPWRAELAEATLRLGDPVTARRLAEEHLARPGAARSWSRGQATRLLTGPPVDGRTAHRPAPAAGPARLSRAEGKVARLASQGHTNREISARLYITTSTVEQHLTRIYRKLGIDRRDELEPLGDRL